MELNIVNPDPSYSPINLIEPTTLGYIHLAAEVRPRPMPHRRLPFVPNGRARTELLGRLKMLANSLEQLETVEKATVFTAVAIPPTSRFSPYLNERADSIHIARFDVVVLIETASPEVARQVQQSTDYRALLDALADVDGFRNSLPLEQRWPSLPWRGIYKAGGAAEHRFLCGYTRIRQPPRICCLVRKKVVVG
jgi:hypothetical protein